MITRHEEQRYATPAAIVAETIIPDANDVIFVASLKRPFRWIAGSSATADNSFVIDQTTQTSNGRWEASSIANVYTGSGTTDALDNGQTSNITVTVTGATTSNADVIKITNADVLGALGLTVISKDVTGTNTVAISVLNETGSDGIAATAVNVAVLEF
jgi:hypothetical protein